MRGTNQGRRSYRFIWLIVLLAVGVFGWFLSERVGRNDHLQREARFLIASRRVWQSRIQINSFQESPICTVNNRAGTLVRVNDEIVVDGQKLYAELAWTNSCLGPGMLIVTSNNRFLWRDPGGKTRKLDIPDLSRIPFWWYLTNP